ncbi:hypothetical protein P691DRAFT_728020 [Macrolepiota fuliginosa MF-IS2]|uniref:F-box domain-containing protein n=1 Tax=Macrolepiota fuliginosa MF-IS2 TaxID=1400762 RepID=A0A9P5XDE9_9AGAR|nr:hypothetical protein P691DRAFT_728020 [Macrolepiota fuliginosa MF-IS2]
MTAMTGLLALPTEVLQTIGDDLGPAKKQLRLVCVQLSVAMDPLVLSHLVINVTRPRLSMSVSQLRLLAHGRSHTAHFIRELSIRSLAPAYDPQGMGAQLAFSGGSWGPTRKRDGGLGVQAGEADMKEHLEGAISNMVNLQVLRWKATPEDPKWTQLAVINGLAHTKSLGYLSLHLSFGSDTSNLWLDRLSGLKRIVISGSCDSFHDHIVKRLGDCISQSPEMSSIDIDRSYWHGDSNTPTLHSLLGNAPLIRLKHLGLHGWFTRLDHVTLPHLRFLKSLTLTNNHDPPYNSHPYSSTAEDIWSALRVSEIHLDRISTDLVNASLIEYLVSYSGLTRLYLRNITAPDQQTSIQLAEVFFDSALAQHSFTLEDLYILPSYEGSWCFGEHIAPIIARCSKLQYLKLAVVSSKVNPSAEGDTVSMLINMTARSLHSLQSLSISTAKAESLRGLERAHLSKKHFSSAAVQIAKAITEHIPEPEYHAFLPPITTNSIKYVPQLQSSFEVDETRSKLRYRRVT